MTKVVLPTSGMAPRVLNPRKAGRKDTNFGREALVIGSKKRRFALLQHSTGALDKSGLRRSHTEA